MTNYPIEALSKGLPAAQPTINLGGRLVCLERPLVMGILNATPDSFYEGSRVEAGDIADRARRMLDSGADWLDIGACSTRPGSQPPSEDEEWRRLEPALRAVREALPEVVLSVDTFRLSIAERAVSDYGAHIYNDVSGSCRAVPGVPYVLTHSADVTALGATLDMVAEVTRWLAEGIDRLHQEGVCDVIADPGFGFGKTTQQNHLLLRHLDHLRRQLPDTPLLVGVSRKSMIWRPLGVTPSEALNGTTVLNTLAVERGAHILRVHDPREARQAITLLQQ